MSEQKNLELPIVRHIYQNFALDSLRWNFFQKRSTNSTSLSLISGGRSRSAPKRSSWLGSLIPSVRSSHGRLNGRNARIVPWTAPHGGRAGRP